MQDTKHSPKSGWVFRGRSSTECREGLQADLIMVGSHGHSAIGRFLLGSVAQAVLRIAPCPVEIVRFPAGDVTPSSHPMKVLLATDGSECSWHGDFGRQTAVAWRNGFQSRRSGGISRPQNTNGCFSTPRPSTLQACWRSYSRMPTPEPSTPSKAPGKYCRPRD